MGRIRKFKCDMCGCMEETSRKDKPEKWKYVKPMPLSAVLAGKQAQRLLVCNVCTDKLEEIAIVITAAAEEGKQNLKLADVISFCARRAWDAANAIDPDAVDPEMGEDADDDEEDGDEEEEAPRKFKRKAPRERRGAAEGDGG